MSSTEFSEWIEFYRLEPFGDERGFWSWGIARILTMIYNRTLGFFKDDKPVKIEDFMPKEPKKPQTTDQMLQVAQMLTIANGGEIIE